MNSKNLGASPSRRYCCSLEFQTSSGKVSFAGRSSASRSPLSKNRLIDFNFENQPVSMSDPTYIFQT